MRGLSCPQCGEKDELRGHSEGEQIEITCLACGSTFPREAPACGSCGLADPVHGSQRMTRYARGLLVAVVGMRNVPLCRVCDAEVAGAVAQRSELVPEGYTSRFLFGEVSTPDSAPAPAPAPARPRARKPRAAVSAASGTVRAAPRDVTPEDHRVVKDPTVRQAIEAFLTSSSGPQDTLCLVLLGAELGPSTHVSQLGSVHQEALPDWVGSKFGEGATPRRQVAVSTIIQLVDHWRDRGWTGSDIASALR